MDVVSDIKRGLTLYNNVRKKSWTILIHFILSVDLFWDF